MELIEHPVDRHLVQLTRIERVNVGVGHVREHILEQAGLLVDRARWFRFALQEPPAADESGECDDGDDGPFMTNHETPLKCRAVTAATSRQAASCTAFL